MIKPPTYSATEIKQMCLTFPMEYDTFKAIVDLVDEEIELYDQEDLVILVEASMVMFSRSLLKLSLKNM